jgi:hypothetical protein
MSIALRSLLIAPALLAGSALVSADQAVAFLAYQSSVPDAWVAETPKSEMRKLQFKVPAPPGGKGGDGAEFVVYFF